jgi:hypothetical protein
MQAKQPSEQQKGSQKQQVASQASGQSEQAKVLNGNAMDDMFIAFTVVQQIMTGLSGAASEGEKVSVITKAVFNLLKCNGGNSS